jgi:hypothetical protein
MCIDSIYDRKNDSSFFLALLFCMFSTLRLHQTGESCSFQMENVIKDALFACQYFSLELCAHTRFISRVCLLKESIQKRRPHSHHYAHYACKKRTPKPIYVVSVFAASVVSIANWLVRVLVLGTSVELLTLSNLLSVTLLTLGISILKEEILMISLNVVRTLLSPRFP